MYGGDIVYVFLLLEYMFFFLQSIFLSVQTDRLYWYSCCPADHENESSIAYKVLEKLYSFMYSLNLTLAVQLVKYQVKKGSFRGSFGTIEKASKLFEFSGTVLHFALITGFDAVEQPSKCIR